MPKRTKRGGLKYFVQESNKRLSKVREGQSLLRVLQDEEDNLAEINNMYESNISLGCHKTQRDIR